MLAREKKHLTEGAGEKPVKQQRKIIKSKNDVRRMIGPIGGTGDVELRIVGDATLIGRLESIATELGAQSVDVLSAASFPSEAVEEEFSDNLSGTILQGVRFREGLTQVDLSRKTGLPQRHISEMENGKRTIGKATARKLANAMKVDYRVFL
jgi:hypothetical protein